LFNLIEKNENKDTGLWFTQYISSMMKCTIKKECHKEQIIKVFTAYSKMLKEQKKNRFQQNAARSVITGLQNYSETLKDEADIYTFMTHMGKKNPKKTVARMKTIIETGKLPEVEEYFTSRDHTEFDTLDELTSIYGIGPAKASHLVNECNVTSLSDLKEKLQQKSPDPLLKLTAAQTLGITHYQDLRTRIPRDEITSYEKRLKICLNKVDPEASICITGSYRRGESSSGDVDMLVSSPNVLDMSDIVASLSTMVIGVLAKGKKKSMLLTRLTKNSVVRHMDIIITSPAQYPFAQLYFTGSKVFNIQMRKHALQKGYTLNEYALTPNSSDIAEVPLMKTEEDIFTFLNYPYVVPTKRSV